MNSRKLIELLSPAKNLDCAKAAILAGADVVYMGASEFGARSNACNDFYAIKEAADFAHSFGAKIYIALNTILSDAELDTAREVAQKSYEAGVDALIVQDLGLLTKELPPIEIHASTQCDIRTVEKARFLESAGFETLVLARELPLSQIEKIAKATSCRIECFVHGALCVSMSGKCYLSYAIGSRSGNRGMCAQPCRMKYSLLDADFKPVKDDAYFLSLKDMNRSNSIGAMLDAGVSAFKIEGRLKDESYVKNITAYYRKILDKEIAKRGLERSSYGESKITFVPNPEKSFNRGFTEYFLHENKTSNASFLTPKSRGEFVGKVLKVSDSGFFYEGIDLANGDGILIETDDCKVYGANVQTCENRFVKTFAKPPKNIVNCKIWRNKDCVFESKLKAKLERKIAIDIEFTKLNNDYEVRFSHAQSKLSYKYLLDAKNLESAKNTEIAKDKLKESLSKLGSTNFEAKSVKIDCEEVPFLSSAQANEIRRTCANNLQNLISQKALNSRLKTSLRPAFAKNFGGIECDYHANVLNESAKKFYQDSGIEITEFAPESGLCDIFKVELMHTRHCILSELGMCKKQHPFKLKEPLYLKNDESTLRLKFDCANCGMSIFKA